MNYEKKKTDLEHRAQLFLRTIESTLPLSPNIPKLKNLIEDLRDDYYSVVVVGEFKHGKSTFINALLGEDLMPVDVTPTTATINAMMYSKETRLEVVKQSGEVEQHPLSKEALNNYTASSDFNPNEVKYLKVFHSAKLIKNKVILVDTPGVNDLNHHRSEITHSFIPRADIVLFMLSMTAPVKRTEQEFLENHLSSHNQIIYLANFLDRIEEEEIPDVIDTLKTRLQNISGNSDPRIYPISALEGLQGKVQADEELLKYSGVTEVEEEIEALINSNSRNKLKFERFRTRFDQILASLLDEIITVENLSKSSLKNLRTQLLFIDAWLDKKGQWEDELHHYLGKREEELSFMALKSADHFGERLRDELLTKIDLYYGNDIKNLVQTQLPITLKNGFKQWIDQYSDYISELLRKLQVEVSKGLSKSFNQSVQIGAIRDQYSYEAAFPVFDSFTGNASIKAGALMGGASTVAILLGGPFLIPIVGMAGMPFLHQKIAEYQLEKVKPELRQKVNQHLDASLKDFRVRLQHYISTEVQAIKKAALEEFTSLVVYVQEAIQKEVREKTVEKKDKQLHLEQLNDLKMKILSFEQEEEDVYERI